jgi:hypothetical protein
MRESFPRASAILLFKRRRKFLTCRMDDDALIVYRFDHLGGDEQSITCFQQQLGAMGVKRIVNDDQEMTGDSYEK